MDSVWLGALIAGLIIGAIPAISGAVKGKIGFAIGDSPHVSLPT